MASPFKIELHHWLLIAALGIALYACYLLVAPYLGSIVLGFIVSMLFMPIHQKILNRMSNAPNIAAILSCLLLTFMVLIPLFVVGIAVIEQGINFFTTAYQWLLHGDAKQLLLHPWVQSLLEFINKWLPFNSIDPQEVIRRAAQTATQLSTQLVSFSSKLLGDLTEMLLSFSLMLFVLFFFLRDNDKLIATLRHVLPLSRTQEDQILIEIEQVAKSAVFGSFLTAIAQGVMGGIAMTMAGFPGLFWGSIMAFASFIPFVGTALIWGPAALYLFLTGDWQWGLFLVIWGVVVVGSIDNFLRPFLMQGDSSMNTLMLFFSLLGGLQLFGLIGLIYGPIIFAVTIVLFRLYETEFQPFLDQQDQR